MQYVNLAADAALSYNNRAEMEVAAMMGMILDSVLNKQLNCYLEKRTMEEFHYHGPTNGIFGYTGANE